MTSFQEELLAVMREQDIRQADIVRRAGLSSGWVSSMVRNGRIPSRETIETMVDRLGLTRAQRTRLLVAAGYGSFSVGVGENEMSPVVAHIVHEITGLSPQQLETVRRLVEQPERIDALAALIGDRRVMLPLGAGHAAWCAGGVATP